METSLKFIQNFLQTNNFSTKNGNDFFQVNHSTVLDHVALSLETKIKNALVILEERKFSEIKEIRFCQKIDQKKLRQFPNQCGFYFLLNEFFGKSLDFEAERQKKIEMMKSFKSSFKKKMEIEFSSIWQNDFSIEDIIIKMKIQKIVEIILYYAFSFKELGNISFAQKFSPLINLFENGVCFGKNGNILYFWEFEKSSSKKQPL